MNTFHDQTSQTDMSLIDNGEIDIFCRTELRRKN